MDESSVRSHIFSEIDWERIKQDLKWGVQNHSPEVWMLILGEEVGEVNKALVENRFDNRGLESYRDELIQVGAVVVAMLECLERSSGIISSDTKKEKDI